MTHARKPVEPWDTDKAAQLAVEQSGLISRLDTFATKKRKA